MKYLKYLNYLIRHKWFVLIECYKVGIIWRGIIHDLSKLRPSEFFFYADHFYGTQKEKSCYSCFHKIWNSQCEFNGSGIGDGEQASQCKDYKVIDEQFDYAWLLHQKRNKHHWQWWVLTEDYGIVKVLDMPLKYRLEMLADWRGAGRAQGNKMSTKEWYEANKDNMKLHPDTRMWVEDMLIIVATR